MEEKNKCIHCDNKVNQYLNYCDECMQIRDFMDEIEKELPEKEVTGYLTRYHKVYADRLILFAKKLKKYYFN